MPQIFDIPYIIVSVVRMGLDERTCAFIFVWTYTIVFYLTTFAGLYFIATLNVMAIVVMLVMIVLQKLFGGKSPRYINFVQRYARP